MLRGALGIALYVIVVLLPLVVMLAVGSPAARTFTRELSVALAFGGLAILGLQVIVSARLRWFKAPYGIDAVYHFHRQMSLVALALIVAHPILLVIDSPGTADWLNIFTAPRRVQIGVIALIALVVIVSLAYFRRHFKIKYETWRRTHGLLALVMLGAAVWHIEVGGYYVTTPVKRALWIAYVALWIAVLAWARLIKPWLLTRRPWRVEKVRQERGSAWTLSLKPCGRPMRFDPGQFVWLHLGASPFAMAEHPFSISSSSEQEHGIDITIKELGDYTATIGETPVGAIAHVEGPYGQFSVDRHGAERYTFIAGGVGITPVMSILRTLADRGDRRPLTLLYGARTLEDMTFADEIEELTARLDLAFVPVLQDAPEDWAGERGFVDTGVLERHLVEPDTAEFFVCGPELMMKAVSKALQEVGVRPAHIRYELFGLV